MGRKGGKGAPGGGRGLASVGEGKARGVGREGEAGLQFADEVKGGFAVGQEEGEGFGDGGEAAVDEPPVGEFIVGEGIEIGVEEAEA